MKYPLQFCIANHIKLVFITLAWLVTDVRLSTTQATEGVRFENMFVSSSICWVSRATILTGRYAPSWGSSTRPDVVQDGKADQIYPLLLRAAGYRTGFFGKWHANTLMLTRIFFEIPISNDRPTARSDTPHRSSATAPWKSSSRNRGKNFSR